jgi:nickel/cobalt transporter (NicO) family protein
MKKALLYLMSTGLNLIILGCAQPVFAHPGYDEKLLQTLIQPNMSLTWMVSGLAIAFVLGAGHALTPGHGKTMVAAYLVGTQGTTQQAFLLGLITTLTHTLGVFALGVIALCASQYILPETLYPILTVISGMTVCAVGVSLLRSRLHLKPEQQDHHRHSSNQHHAHVHHHHHPDHPTHDHSHRLPQGGVTLRSLVALGIAGGLVPCPSALILLLSAIAFHQVILGLFLTVAFSLGMACTLIAIGLAVVYASQWIEHVPSLIKIPRTVPILSAIAVIFAGAGLTFSAIL